jgi:hypothetical protein
LPIRNKPIKREEIPFSENQGISEIKVGISLRTYLFPKFPSYLPFRGLGIWISGEHADPYPQVFFLFLLLIQQNPIF